MPSQTLTIIADDQNLQARLAHRLRSSGMEVTTVAVWDNRPASNGEASAIVLTDESIVDDDALKFYQQLREKSGSVLLVAGRLDAPPSNGASSISSLTTTRQSAGGRACLELLLDAITALVRQTRGMSGETDRLAYRGLELERERLQGRIDGRPLCLTPTEFRILWMLTKRPGHVADRECLLRACRKNGARSRTVDAHVRTIRHKLRPRDNFIETIRGVGYRLNSDE